MKISVVIPAYNEELFLPRLLTSLSQQTYKPFEIIVVDNNSTDKTAAIAKQYGAKVLREQEQGYAFACNRGFFAACGDVIARADADYVVQKDWVKKIAHAFTSDKTLVALGGPIYPLESKWWENFLYYPGIVIWMYILMFLRRGFFFSNMATRRNAFLKVGGFNTDIPFGEDGEICLALKRIGKVGLFTRIYVYTSLRRIRSLGLIRSILDYSIGNQIKLWQGNNNKCVGMEPVRVLPTQPPKPHTPWVFLYIMPICVLVLITGTMYAYAGVRNAPRITQEKPQSTMLSTFGKRITHLQQEFVKQLSQITATP